MKKKTGDILYGSFVNIVIVFALVITLYPFLYVFSMSISAPESVLRNEVLLFPKGFSLMAYSKVLGNDTIWRSYYNTIWYTVVGTFFNTIITIMAAYPLSRSKFFARNFFMFMFVFTMFFTGGMVPTFIVVTKVGLFGSRWAMVLPVLINTWNLVICRTYMQSLPEELFENANIEGCSEWRIISDIVVPLSRPIVAVLILFYGVSHWNSFFNALLYLPKQDLHPIQIYLRRVLIENSPETMEMYAGVDHSIGLLSMMQIKYAVVIVAILPIIMLYPFLQKHFIKGVMIGAIKG